jgi:hypothetical protein
MAHVRGRTCVGTYTFTPNPKLTGLSTQLDFVDEISREAEYFQL